MSYSSFPPSSYFEPNPVQSPLYYYAPTLVQYYDLIKVILLVEFAVLIFGLLLALFFKFYFDYREKKFNQHSSAYKTTLLKAMKSNEPFKITNVSKWQKLNYLIPAMAAIDTLPGSQKWNAIKQEISQKVLLPVARVWALKKSWIKRVKAARCFAFSPSVEDQNSIIKLINDPVPLVQYTSILSAVKLGTPASTEAIIAAMSKSSRFERFPLKDALRQCDAKTFSLLETKLTQPLSAYDKVSCLEALNGKIYHNISSSLENNLYDPHKNVRLATIRALGNYPMSQVAGRLIQLLDHVEWEVRAVTAQALGHKGLDVAIPKLTALLSDKVWWVRVNAAASLKKIGEGGMKALKMQDPDIDKFAYDISKFILSN